MKQSEGGQKANRSDNGASLDPKSAEKSANDGEFHQPRVNHYRTQS